MIGKFTNYQIVGILIGVILFGIAMIYNNVLLSIFSTCIIIFSIIVVSA